jgi:hypothetical protein
VFFRLSGVLVRRSDQFVFHACHHTGWRLAVSGSRRS